MSIPTAQFDVRRIDDESLMDLRKNCIKHIMPMAPKFGSWLHGWLDAEQIRRREMPDQGRVSHLTGVPIDIKSWTNADVGHGMAAVTQLSYCMFDEALGMMVDRLCLVFSGECRRRLTANEGAAT